MKTATGPCACGRAGVAMKNGYSVCAVCLRMDKQRTAKPKKKKVERKGWWSTYGLEP